MFKRHRRFYYCWSLCKKIENNLCNKLAEITVFIRSKGFLHKIFPRN